MDKVSCWCPAREKVAVLHSYCLLNCCLLTISRPIPIFNRWSLSLRLEEDLQRETRHLRGRGLKTKEADPTEAFPLEEYTIQHLRSSPTKQRRNSLKRRLLPTFAIIELVVTTGATINHGHSFQ